MSRAQAHSHASAVGQYVTVTLMNGTQMSGTVFTYTPDPRNPLLVLAQNLAAGGKPTFKVLNTNFIRDFVVEPSSKAPTSHKLPPSLDCGAMLPPLVAANVPKTVKNEMQKRKDLLVNFDGDTPIAAVDTFFHIVRVWHTAKWDGGAIVINKDGDKAVTVVARDKDWNYPTVESNDAETKSRIEKLLAKAAQQ